MIQLRRYLWVGLFVVGCGGAPPASERAGAEARPAGTDGKEFALQDSSTAGEAHGVEPSKIEASATHAAMKFFVVNKRNGEPISGIVISLQDADGNKFYTGETDALGYGEVLVPVGREYEVVYLSLGHKDVTATVKVTDEPRQNIKLTLRYKPLEPVVVAEPSAEDPPAAAPTFRLHGVRFASGSAELLPKSLPRLDGVVEYMTYKKSARIEIAGHTDNVGSAKVNKALSLKRAEACRAYLVDQGIDASRIEAIGYGAERPEFPNHTEEGRRKNRRIEAREL